MGKLSVGGDSFSEGVKLCFGWQVLVKKEIDHFLEDTIVSKVLDGKSSIIETCAKTNSGYVTLSCNDACETTSLLRLGFLLRHNNNPIIIKERIKS